MTMEKNLEVNSKLVAFEGIIGRRDYALNIVYISMLNLLITLPYSFWVMKNAQSSSELFNIGTMLTSMPILLKLWVLVGTAAILPLSISNLIRRLNDICGKVNKNLNFFFAALLVIFAYATYVLPFILTMFMSFICFVAGVILLFTPGKITSQMPYDVTKQFNWGAFFGTWIWGLINKSYIPCWYLLLFFTPLGFYFQLICGLKGNEWAYKNKKCTDVEKFNTSQKKQATIWSVLILVGVPLLYFMFLILLIVGVVAASSLNDPNTTLNKMETITKGITSIYFESYEITETENKFYILPYDWRTSTFTEKKRLLDMAATQAAMERSKKFPKKNEYYSKTTELNRTKIYSSKTNQLLGEFYLDDKNLTSFKEGFMAAVKAYKFYKIKE